MKSKKTIQILPLLIILVFLLCSCGNSTNDIVGLWESSGSENIFYNSVEFFSDGTHVTETPGWSGTYTTDGNRLRISGKLYSEVFSFELSNNGNQLILTNSLGYSKTYARAN